MNTINIIQIYAPTTAANKAVLNYFYESLLVISLRETVLRNVPSREITTVMGDFNAKIGRTAEDDDLRQIVGKFGIGERNDRGERLLDLCMEHQLTVANTCLQHHLRRVYTWKSPGLHKKPN